MAIVPSPDQLVTALNDLAGPEDDPSNDKWFFQKWVNHDGVIFKVFVAGNLVHTVVRPSLHNVTPDQGKAFVFVGKSLNQIWDSIYLDKQASTTSTRKQSQKHSQTTTRPLPRVAKPQPSQQTWPHLNVKRRKFNWTKHELKELQNCFQRSFNWRCLGLMLLLRAARTNIMWLILIIVSLCFLSCWGAGG